MRGAIHQEATDSMDSTDLNTNMIRENQWNPWRFCFCFVNDLCAITSDAVSYLCRGIQAAFNLRRRLHVHWSRLVGESRVRKKASILLE